MGRLLAIANGERVDRSPFASLPNAAGAIYGRQTIPIDCRDPGRSPVKLSCRPGASRIGDQSPGITGKTPGIRIGARSADSTTSPSMTMVLSSLV